MQIYQTRFAIISIEVTNDYYCTRLLFVLTIQRLNLILMVLRVKMPSIKKQKQFHNESVFLCRMFTFGVHLTLSHYVQCIYFLNAKL